MKVEIPGISQPVRISPREAQIVALLALKGELYAYQIATLLGTEGLHSSIHVHLTRLVRKGVLISRTITSEQNGIRLPRRYVRLRPSIRRINEISDAHERGESGFSYA